MSPYPYSSYTYYSCGSAWYQPQYEGDTVVYVTVPDPHQSSTTVVTHNEVAPVSGSHRDGRKRPSVLDIEITHRRCGDARRARGSEILGSLDG